VTSDDTVAVRVAARVRREAIEASRKAVRCWMKVGVRVAGASPAACGVRVRLGSGAAARARRCSVRDALRSQPTVKDWAGCDPREGLQPSRGASGLMWDLSGEEDTGWLGLCARSCPWAFTCASTGRICWLTPWRALRTGPDPAVVAGSTGRVETNGLGRGAPAVIL